MEEIKRISLMSGVTLTCAQTRKFKTSHWYVGLAVPLSSKSAALNALLPRVLRQGTANHPDSRSIAQRLEELYGASMEASVSKRGEVQWLGFQGAFLDDALVPHGSQMTDQAARMLGELLLRPATRNGRLRTDFVELEKRHLIDDIQSIVNNKGYYAMQQSLEKMCAGEAYRVSRYGSLREAKRLSVARLNQQYHALLSSSPVELYYSGSAEPEQVARAWREALMELPRARQLSEAHTDWLVQPQKVRRFSESMDVNQARLVMGFRTLCTLNAPSYPALVVANTLLGGGAASRLFTTVRERQSLCYAIHSVLDKYKGLLLVQAGVAPEQLERTEEEILHQLLLLQDDQYTQEELQNAKLSAAAQFRRIPDSQPLQAEYWLGLRQAELQISPAELAAQIDSVTREQVTQALRRLALDSVYTLTSDPKEEVPEQ